MNNTESYGLCDRIRQARNGTELSLLLLEGRGYQFASESTRRRWKKIAELRMEFLTQKRVHYAG